MSVRFTLESSELFKDAPDINLFIKAYSQSSYGQRADREREHAASRIHHGEKLIFHSESRKSKIQNMCLLKILISRENKTRDF